MPNLKKIRVERFSICLAFILIFTQTQVYAEPTPQSSVDSNSSEEAIISDQALVNTDSLNASQPLLTQNQVPKLVLRWDCGNCVQNEKVIPLIEETYATIASAKGYSVSESEVAEVVITEYRQRKPGLRVMFGFLAGKDILATRITFRGKYFLADDYSANALSGMNSLCATVSQKMFDHIASKIHAQ